MKRNMYTENRANYNNDRPFCWMYKSIWVCVASRNYFGNVSLNISPQFYRVPYYHHPLSLLLLLYSQHIVVVGIYIWVVYIYPPHVCSPQIFIVLPEICWKLKLPNYTRAEWKFLPLRFFLFYYYFSVCM